MIEIPRPLPMSYFRYVGRNDKNQSLVGKIQAADVDEAKVRLERMGITVEKFGDDNAPIAPVLNPEEANPAVSPSHQDTKKPAPAAPEKSELPPPPKANIPTLIAPPNPVSEARVSDTIGALSRVAQKGLGKPPSGRRQTFVFGDAESMGRQLEEMLARNGQVIHMSMCADLNGKLKIAVVVEHDFMEKK